MDFFSSKDFTKTLKQLGFCLCFAKQFNIEEEFLMFDIYLNSRICNKIRASKA